MDKHLIEAFQQENVQLFVGSGLSSECYPSASELREILLRETIVIDGSEKTLKDILPPNATVSLQDAAEFYEIYNGSEELISKIKEIYMSPRNPKAIHEQMWQLPGIRMIYTTNYDCLIELAHSRPYQEPFVATKLAELRNVSLNRKIVFKPHGCANNSVQRSDFVITRTDYLKYSHTKTLEELKTLYDIFTKTFLFLGYSLDDSNMRNIIVEASRLANIRAYAILNVVPKPESKYWFERFNFKLLEMDAEQFVNNALNIFPPDNSEWARKILKRTDLKEKIANIGVKLIRRHCAEAGRTGVNIILDSGSTCLFLAKSLLREIEKERIGNVISALRPDRNEGQNLTASSHSLDEEGPLDPGRLTIITNSTPLIGMISAERRALDRGLGLFATGGLLRSETQALQFYSDELLRTFLNGDLDNLKKASDGDSTPQSQLGRPTIAFLGATAFDDRHLSTRTKQEIFAKSQFIKHADRVYVLVDRAKYQQLDKGMVFADIDDSKMVFITDDRGQLKEFVQSGHKVIDRIGGHESIGRWL